MQCPAVGVPMHLGTLLRGPGAGDVRWPGGDPSCGACLPVACWGCVARVSGLCASLGYLAHLALSMLLVGVFSDHFVRALDMRQEQLSVLLWQIRPHRMGCVLTSPTVHLSL